MVLKAEGFKTLNSFSVQSECPTAVALSLLTGRLVAAGAIGYQTSRQVEHLIKKQKCFKSFNHLSIGPICC